MPTSGQRGTQISFLIFQPHTARKIYSKQMLPDNELPFFVAGQAQLFLAYDDVLLAPAICYESLQDAHAEYAKEKGANVYLASVAKSENGVNGGYKHYPKVAKQHGRTVLTANSYRFSDDFISFGSSAVWSSAGECVASLGK